MGKGKIGAPCSEHASTQKLEGALPSVFPRGRKVLNYPHSLRGQSIHGMRVVKRIFLARQAETGIIVAGIGA